MIVDIFAPLVQIWHFLIKSYKSEEESKNYIIKKPCTKLSIEVLCSQYSQVPSSKKTFLAVNFMVYCKQTFFQQSVPLKTAILYPLCPYMPYIVLFVVLVTEANSNAVPLSNCKTSCSTMTKLQNLSFLQSCPLIIQHSILN